MNFAYETYLKVQGHEYVVGVDEVGRGPWAGPIVAGAVIFDESISEKTEFLEMINSSKKISEKKRDLLNEQIKEFAVAWALGEVTHVEIDKINIGNANRLAFNRAIENLSVKPTYIVSDFIAKTDFSLPYQTFKKGDEKIVSIAAASIIAKVYRDNLMKEYEEKFPEYGFAKHKGYGTKQHRQAIDEHGYCEIHRRSFSI